MACPRCLAVSTPESCKTQLSSHEKERLKILIRAGSQFIGIRLQHRSQPPKDALEVSGMIERFGWLPKSLPDWEDFTPDD